MGQSQIKTQSIINPINQGRWEILVTKSRSQQIVELLRGMQASSPDIEASSVVSVDGLTIAAALPQNVEEDRVAAMSAAMLSLGERIAIELGRGNLEQVYIKGTDGYVVLMSVGSEAVLTALARENAKLGFLLLDMRRVVDSLAELLQE
jgi:predicted regulator of Ras-like GTPase activity (Roadblock/LC7/MglB family)